MIEKWLALGTITFGICFGSSLLASRDVKRSAVSGAIAVPAALVGIAVLEKGKKRSLRDEITGLEARLIELKKSKNTLEEESASLEKRLAERETEKEVRDGDISRLNDELEQLRLEKEAGDSEIGELTAWKQKLSGELTELQSRRERCIEEIGNLETRARELNERISELRGQESASIENNDRLQRERRDLETAIATSRDELQGLNEAIETLLEQERSLEIQTGGLQRQESNLQENIEVLNREIQKLKEERDGLIEEIERLKKNGTVIIRVPERPRTIDALVINNLWENQIYPFWHHRSHPEKQRFLGSIPIQQEESDKLFALFEKPLRGFASINYDILDKRFSSYNNGRLTCKKRNWIKLFTFLFSEYAYFYSKDNSDKNNEDNIDKGFWVDLSRKLGISHKESVANAFREVTKQGIDDLKLIQTKNGYKYISNLWIQNGIPVKNLPHLSELLQEITEDYSWWEIAHSDPIDIAALLLQYWRENHSHRRTLGHFLNISLSGETGAEPIAGILVQGISRVADALESNNMPIHILQSPNATIQLLEGYEFPKSFFLRDWNQLIEILKPRKGSRNQIISHKRKSLFLFLDVVDTGQTQLILPEQKIWKPDWEKFREASCSIEPWDGQIPQQGKLEIPELVIEVNKTEPIYSLELLNSDRQIIYDWKTRGIDRSLPCLIFDAMRGTHIPVYLPNAQIIGMEEIIYFCPKEITTKFSGEIETIDPYIPCSIRGWRGQQIRILDRAASIDLAFPDDRPPRKILWDRDSEPHPALVGTRLMNLKGIDTYLDPPTFWYPPSDRDLTIQMVLDNLNKRTTVARQTYPRSKSSEWYQIPLQEWITEPDPAPPALRSRYQVYFEIDYRRWTYQFEIRQNYRILETPSIASPTVELNTGEPIPCICNSSERFWAKVITIGGLWVLEEIVFLLDNGKESIAYRVQADQSGQVIFNLSALYDALSRSNYYRLEYQRLGLETRKLLEYRA
ncbi:hypothetical protein V0288_20230 [Pannus brasiliensis CCIBt3594]|uniref:Uncharacterized protein n=1 Tax=Pannus brasiliensis CCIBt3594 TaxID=1427578 RepID=A0AAW9QWJ2_9CHRO